MLHPDHWGQGLGSEVAWLLLAFGSAHLGLHRIWATCHPDNTGSRRGLEKVGMLYEGRLRGHLLVGGQFRDSLSFAVLATDPRPATSVVVT